MKARLTTAGVLLLAVALVACGSVSNSRKIDYRNTAVLPPLEVPPDLSSLPDPAGGAPDTNASRSATYSGYAGVQQAQAPGAVRVLPEFSDVRLVRSGQTRYVAVRAEPEGVWDQVRDFLRRAGLSIAAEDPQAGLIETDWAENYAMVGADQNKLTKWFKSLFSTGIRDKYRLRLERGVEPGTTEVYIVHEGMVEIAPDELEQENRARPGWKPRPRDPSLEAEMLSRLVVHLGGPARVQETVVAQSEAAPAEPLPAAPSARLVRNGDGAPLLALEDSLERAWRRVGLSLDRIGFTVEDRDRSKGIYYVRYIDPEAVERNQPGFFARILGTEEPTPPTQYRVHLTPDENGTRVEVLGENDDPASAKAGERILSLLYEQLK